MLFFYHLNVVEKRLLTEFSVIFFHIILINCCSWKKINWILYIRVSCITFLIK